MKKTEKDYEYLETSEEMLSRGMRRISRPKRLDNLSKDKKSRITIFLDADIVDSFKKEAETTNEGYQTLINLALRKIVDGKQKEAEKQHIKREILEDKEFLRELKKALV